MSDSLTLETWRPVVGYEGWYEVSDLGRVWRVERRIEWSSVRGNPAGRLFPGGFLQPKPSKQGYIRVMLSRKSHPWGVRVHTLVLTAFRGPCPDGMQALHWDDDKTNNTLANLRWGTPTENKYDCVKNGHHHYAKRDRCRRGHLFAGANVMVRTDGGSRRCRSCKYATDHRAATEDEIQRLADAFYSQLMVESAA